MQIEIKLDESCKEPKIIIHTDRMTEEVSQIVKLLSEEKPEVFAAIHENGEIILLEQTEIIRIYAENDRVYAKTKDGSYRLKARLYELEERLNKKMFIRISNSEIIRLKFFRDDLCFDVRQNSNVCFKALRQKNQTGIGIIEMVVCVKNIFFTHRNGGYHEKKNFMQSAYRCADRSGNQYCNHNFLFTHIR